jgi:hypothetical protein
LKFASLKKLFLLQYYLKARFHFNKDQFADLMVISGIAGTISQVCQRLVCLIVICIPFVSNIALIPFIPIEKLKHGQKENNLKIKAIMQLLLMPKLVPAFGEEKLLSVGLFFGCAHVSTLRLCHNSLTCQNDLSNKYFCH